MRVVVAPDKFRGTVTAIEAAAALADGARDAGWEPVTAPLADGGEGTLEVLGGGNRTLDGHRPARRAGQRRLAARRRPRRGGDEPRLRPATRRGPAAQRSDGGDQPRHGRARRRGDPRRRPRGAGRRRRVGLHGRRARRGRGPARPGPARRQPRVRRARRLRRRDPVPRRAAAVRPAEGGDARAGAGARGPAARARRGLPRRVRRRRAGPARVGRRGGGLGGGLAALGAALEPGFHLIAGAVGLPALLDGADLVLTGEGRLDAQSFDGKVVGGVAALAGQAGVPWCAVVGTAAERPDGAAVLDLVATFGREAAMNRTAACLRAAARDLLSRRAG